MNIETWNTDHAVVAELGRRLARCRLSMGTTQAALAFEAGVSKRTLERIEAGQSVQFVSLVRVLRALRLVENLEALAPAEGPGPMELLRMQGRRRQRASSARRTAPAPAPKTEDGGG